MMLIHCSVLVSAPEVRLWSQAPHPCGWAQGRPIISLTHPGAFSPDLALHISVKTVLGMTLCS